VLGAKALEHFSCADGLELTAVERVDAIRDLVGPFGDDLVLGLVVRARPSADAALSAAGAPSRGSPRLSASAWERASSSPGSLASREGGRESFQLQRETAQRHAAPADSKLLKLRDFASRQRTLDRLARLTPVAAGRVFSAGFPGCLRCGQCLSRRASVEHCTRELDRPCESPRLLLVQHSRRQPYDRLALEYRPRELRWIGLTAPPAQLRGPRWAFSDRDRGPVTTISITRSSARVGRPFLH